MVLVECEFWKVVCADWDQNYQQQICRYVCVHSQHVGPRPFEIRIQKQSTTATLIKQSLAVLNRYHFYQSNSYDKFRSNATNKLWLFGLQKDGPHLVEWRSRVHLALIQTKLCFMRIMAQSTFVLIKPLNKMKENHGDLVSAINI